MRILISSNYTPAWIRARKGIKFVNEGWIESLIKLLTGQKDVCLGVSYPQQDEQQIVFDEDNGICAYGYYSDAKMTFEYQPAIRTQAKEIVEHFQPDVIHLMGSEFPHSKAVFDGCADVGKDDRVVLSIQGLVSYYSTHYLLGIPHKYTLGHSIIEMRFGGSLKAEQKSYEYRGEYEVQLIRNLKYIIGRSEWDKACAKMLNPQIHYYVNQENLRSSFYESRKWNLDDCEKYSIFVSQGTYTIKGLHFMLQALAIINKTYPDVKLYVGGNCPVHPVKWKRNSYGNYLASLIADNDLSNNIIFCGAMPEDKMREQYLQSHVFVCPSLVENSSNSIGEAMLLGMPVVASFVGGNDTMVAEGEGLLYPVDAVYMLAWQVMKVFKDPELAVKMGQKAMAHAQERHDREKNVAELIEIYSMIECE